MLALKIPGVDGTPVMRRVYPRGTLAAQVLGEVGTEGHGLSGIELADEHVLHGRTGERRVVSDAIGQPVSISEPHAEAPGQDIKLTLDANIQQRTEDVLGAVAQAFSPKDATAIVMDPRSGAVLAVANWPQVNANDPGAASPEALRDRAVSFAYEPGSTFKVVTVSGALQEGLITPEQRLHGAGPDPGRRPHDPRRHRTRRSKRSRPRRSSRARATSARSRSAKSSGRRASTPGCTGSASARPPASTCRARKRG